MSYSWVPSPNFDAGRPGPIRWVVWHDTEGVETFGAARGVAVGWFAKSISQVSAHVVCDNADVVECVKPGDTAWHCGPKGNPYGYGIEIVGQASQSVTDWTDAYSLAALENAASWVLSVPVLAALPRRFLTDAELASGASGHITHAMVSRVLGGTTHTDPGPNFPFDAVTHFLNGGSVMNWTDTAIPDYSKTPPVNLQADVTLGWMALHAGQAAAAAEAASAKLDVLTAKVEALAVGSGTVDLDALAAKVADVLSSRLAS